MKKLVVLSGAGISAESGISTFRDADGLWENHDIMDVATPEGWARNKELVLSFYNERRKQAKEVLPNAAHKELAALEQYFDTTIITQNIDNLHEQAGSSNVIHLHGELFKCQSTADPSLVYNMDDWALNIGDKCPKGSQLRPFVVWFGEAVPMMEPAMQAAMSADIFIVIGTSMNVYPAAGLIDYVREDAPKFVIDPKLPEVNPYPNLEMIEKTATQGMKILTPKLISSFQ